MKCKIFKESSQQQCVSLHTEGVMEVTVSLYGSKTDEKLPASLFRFRKPNNPLNNKKGR